MPCLINTALSWIKMEEDKMGLGNRGEGLGGEDSGESVARM